MSIPNQLASIGFGELPKQRLFEETARLALDLTASEREALSSDNDLEGVLAVCSHSARCCYGCRVKMEAQNAEASRVTLSECSWLLRISWSLSSNGFVRSPRFFNSRTFAGRRKRKNR
jgi:hypothetical protein